MASALLTIMNVHIKEKCALGEHQCGR